MSIYAANNIARAVQRLARRGDTGLSGIICNSNGDDALERAVVPAFAQRLGSAFVEFVPRSSVIQVCELEGRAVVEHAPQSEEAAIFPGARAEGDGKRRESDPDACGGAARARRAISESLDTG